VRAAAQAAPEGPLSGVGVGVKDVFAVDGLPMRAGSTLPPQRLDRPQATAVSRLVGAGAVVIGKTVTAEFAFFEPGPTRNPWNPEHTPGGSSSGSAAAVAAGLVPLALGTQTIGSVVRPAAFCGVVGFRPTFGRVPTDGMIPFAPSLDTVGWFTATVADAELAAAAAVTDWKPHPQRAQRPVLGVPDEAYLAAAQPDARQAFAAQLDRLRAAGFTVRRSALFADAEALAGTLFTVSRWEFARTHREWFDEFGDRYRPKTAEAVRVGRGIGADEYTAARAAQERARSAYVATTAAEHVDVWVTPGATGPAPAGLTSTGDPAMSSPFTLVGAPALNVPAGVDAAGLPLGVQCAAVPGADEALLADAATIEDVLRSAR
jgi:Asp-tRNA(Asn)/Glu-tRNA(Gln) amidotransferase A subunit family amidase